MSHTPYRRWSRLDLTYALWHYHPDLPREVQEEALSWAFALWEQGTRFRFRRVGDEQPADIEIRWLDQPSGYYAWANPPPFNGNQQAQDGNIWFNLAYQWDVIEQPNDTPPIDLLTLAAHEIGHAIGLGHDTFDPSSLMRPIYAGSVRQLGWYEQDCYRYLYHDGKPCEHCHFFGEHDTAVDCECHAR